MPLMEGAAKTPPALERVLSAAGIAALCAAIMFASARLTRRPDGVLRRPSTDGSRTKFSGPAQAAASLLPDYTRAIPLGAFGAAAPSLRPGMRVAADTSGGKTLTGTILSVGAGSVQIRVESWTSAKPSPRRP